MRTIQQKNKIQKGNIQLISLCLGRLNSYKERLKLKILKLDTGITKRQNKS